MEPGSKGKEDFIFIFFLEPCYGLSALILLSLGFRSMKITCKELLKELIVFSLATQSHMEQIASVLRYVKSRPQEKECADSVCLRNTVMSVGFGIRDLGPHAAFALLLDLEQLTYYLFA